MNPFGLVIPGLVGIEAVLVILRLRKVIAWRWWMMTPVWVGAVIFMVEATAVATVVLVVRDLIRWLLP
jgi:membrane-bound ClpP family serine protease